MLAKMISTLERIQEQRPLILCLTNLVTMDFVANALLAVGAKPIMSCCDQEIRELVKLSSCVYINTGTVHENFVQRTRIAVSPAMLYQKPIVVDPVGSGATDMRTTLGRELAPHASIIRGNASEIRALSFSSATAGVEATHSSEDALAAAQQLVAKHSNVVVISGATDLVVGKSEIERLNYGSQMMRIVTGMGCALTAVIAAFRAVEPDPFLAAKLATAFFGQCGEQAAEKSAGPGSFKVNFVDALYESRRA